MLPNLTVSIDLYTDHCIITFYCCFLKGEDMREGNSPSWFNPVEALQVMKYLQALVNHTSASAPNITFDDIGIITPYRKQVGNHTCCTHHGTVGNRQFHGKAILGDPFGICICPHRMLLQYHLHTKLFVILVHDSTP